MPLTTAAIARLLEWGFTEESVTRPTTWYVALFTAAPNVGGGGTEVSGGGYVREAVTFSRDGNVVANDAIVEWLPATASWGTITHGAVFDSASGGVMLFFAELPTAKTVGENDIARISVGELSNAIDPPV